MKSALNSIPKGEKPIAMLYFNKDGYSVYCKKYKESILVGLISAMKADISLLSIMVKITIQKI